MMLMAFSRHRRLLVCLFFFAAGFGLALLLAGR